MKQFLKEGLLGNIVSILLSLTIIMVCMYVYCGNEPLLYAELMALSVVIQVFAFSMYSSIAKKSTLLRFVSVLGAFFCICLLIIIAVKSGKNASSVEFFIWFLSPQGLVEFSVSYIIAIYIIINFFISSTIYYFSAVRYRMIMTFIITVIPFAFYRKEGEEVPVMFAFLLLMMYVALLIHCRHTNLKSNQKMIIDSGYRKSILIFLTGASLIALIIPKPELNIDNSWANYIFEYQNFTKYMLEKLGIVSDTAGSHDLFMSSQNIEMYEVYADEIPLHLKIQTFTDYDYSKNIWKVSGPDKTKNESDSAVDLSDAGSRNDGLNDALFDDSNLHHLDPVIFCLAVNEASVRDPAFAEKYDLKDFSCITGDYHKRLIISKSNFNSSYFILPNLTYSIKQKPSNDSIYYDEEKSIVYKKGTVRYFEAAYFSQDIIYDASYNKFLKSFHDYETFGQLISDMKKVMEENDVTIYDNVLNAYEDEYNKAVNTMFSLENVPDSIIDLAKNITKDSASPFEKALSIEKYFSNNGFYYDLSYKRAEDFSMETLLFKDKKGICSDYATAAALLARCVGIPARYENGVLFQNADENGRGSIKDTDMHAYPEVFIPGYGWMVIEPTSMDEAETGLKFSISAVTLCFTIAAIIIVFLMVILIPKIKEKIFRKRINGSKRSIAFELVICRIRDLLKLDSSLTIEQISDEITARFSEDYRLSSDLINEGLYGNLKMTDKIFEQIYSYYTGLYDKIKESKKRRSVKK